MLLMQEAIDGLNLDANYTQGPAILRGSLSIRTAKAQGEALATFDLQKTADRLFAIDLASTWRAVIDSAAEKERR